MSGAPLPLVKTPAQLAEVVDALSREPWIGVDTEFIRETTFFPRVALLQVSGRDRAWLVDPLALKAQDLEPLLELLRDPSRKKVMHAAFADQECLYWSYGVIAEPVLDTAAAAALLGYGDSIGLGKLLKDVLNVNVGKGRARVKWLERPLPRELLLYAEQDVIHLVPLAQKLHAELERKGRVAWAFRESTVEKEAFDIPPEEMALRVAKGGQWDARSLGRLVGLFRWREQRARSANLPRPWVAGNEVLVALARVGPRNVEELRVFRGLGAKEVERHGATILEAMRRGEGEPIEPPDPPQERYFGNRESEEHCLDLVKAYVSFLAARHEVVPRLLLSAPKALALLRSRKGGVPGWIAEGVLSDDAAKLIGDDLEDFLDGRKALGIRSGRLAILDVNESGAQDRRP